MVVWKCDGCGAERERLHCASPACECGWCSWSSVYIRPATNREPEPDDDGGLLSFGVLLIGMVLGAGVACVGMFAAVMLGK